MKTFNNLPPLAKQHLDEFSEELDHSEIVFGLLFEERSSSFGQNGPVRRNFKNAEDETNVLGKEKDSSISSGQMSVYDIVREYHSQNKNRSKAGGNTDAELLIRGSKPNYEGYSERDNKYGKNSTNMTANSSMRSKDRQVNFLVVRGNSDKRSKSPVRGDVPVKIPCVPTSL